MPRLRKTETQQADEALRKLILIKMVEKDIKTKAALAVPLHICADSVYAKFNGDTEWTRSELRRLFRYLNFTDEEKLAVL